MWAAPQPNEVVGVVFFCGIVKIKETKHLFVKDCSGSRKIELNDKDPWVMTETKVFQ